MSSQRILVATYCNTLRSYRRIDPYDSIGCNVGNNVFGGAINSYFYSKSVNSQFIGYYELEAKLSSDKNWVNENFDVVVFAEANSFHELQLHAIDRLYRLVEAIDKPIYILGIGAQSSKDYSFDYLPLIADKVKPLLDLLFNKGGQVTVRGEFTREVFERLGYPNLFVSGCPSMYFNGSNFEVSYSKVERESFLPIFNGDKNKIIKYLEKFPESKGRCHKLKFAPYWS